MARILLFAVLLVTVQAAHNRHNPRFPKISEDYDTSIIKKVPCSSENELLRDDIIRKSRCGEPKEVFEYLEVSKGQTKSAHKEIIPGGVWVKRCVGLCDSNSKCVPLKKQMRYIPVRIYDMHTDREMCATYKIEEHLSCGCCTGTPQQCAPRQVYDPRKCACRCPNRKEKRACRSKPNQIMRWNPSKCTCEERKRIR